MLIKLEPRNNLMKSIIFLIVMITMIEKIEMEDIIEIEKIEEMEDIIETEEIEEKHKIIEPKMIINMNIRLINKRQMTDKENKSLKTKRLLTNK